MVNSGSTGQTSELFQESQSFNLRELESADLESNVLVFEGLVNGSRYCALQIRRWDLTTGGDSLARNKMLPYTASCQRQNMHWWVVTADGADD